MPKLKPTPDNVIWGGLFGDERDYVILRYEEADPVKRYTIKTDRGQYIITTGEQLRKGLKIVHALVDNKAEVYEGQMGVHKLRLLKTINATKPQPQPTQTKLKLPRTPAVIFVHHTIFPTQEQPKQAISTTQSQSGPTKQEVLRTILQYIKGHASKEIVERTIVKYQRFSDRERHTEPLEEEKPRSRLKQTSQTTTSYNKPSPSPPPQSKKEMPKEMYYYDGSLHPTPPSDPDKKYYVYRREGDKYVYTGYFTTRRIEELSKKESEAWKKYNELIEKRKQLEREGHWKDDEWYKVFKEQQRWKEIWKGLKKQRHAAMVQAGIRSKESLPGHILPTAPLHPPPPKRGVLDYTSPVDTKKASGKVYRNEGLAPGIYTSEGYKPTNKPKSSSPSSPLDRVEAVAQGQLHKQKTIDVVKKARELANKGYTPEQIEDELNKIVGKPVVEIQKPQIEIKKPQPPKHETITPVDDVVTKLKETKVALEEKLDKTTNPIERVETAFALAPVALATEGLNAITKPLTGKTLNEIIPEPVKKAGEKIAEVSHEFTKKKDEIIDKVLYKDNMTTYTAIQTVYADSNTLINPDVADLIANLNVKDAIQRKKNEQEVTEKVFKEALAKRHDSFIKGVTDAPALLAMTPNFVYDVINSPVDTAARIAKSAVQSPNRFVGQVAGAIVGGEAIGKVGGRALKYIPIKRQTYIKGAKIVELERSGLPSGTTKAFRVDISPTEFIDIAKGSTEGFRHVKLITGERWRLGRAKSPTELGERAQTLAMIKEIDVSKIPNEVNVVKREGIGKAELTYRAEPETVREYNLEKGKVERIFKVEEPFKLESISDVSKLIHTTGVGRIPNVEAEIFRGNVVKEVGESFGITPTLDLKTLDVHPEVEPLPFSSTLESLRKGSEGWIKFERQSIVRYWREKEGELIPTLSPPKKLRIQYIEFRPDLLYKLSASERERLLAKGGKVDIDKLLKPETTVKKRFRDTVKESLGVEIVKEEEMKPLKDIALEKMKSKEYRRNLAKTLRDIYGKEEGRGKVAVTREGRSVVESVEEGAKEGAKGEERIATDYPVLKEESFFDVLRRGSKRVEEMARRIEEVGRTATNVAIGSTSVGIGLNATNKKFEDIIKGTTGVGVGGLVEVRGMRETQKTKKGDSGNKIKEGSDKRFRDISQEIQDTITRAIGGSIKIEPSKPLIIKPPIINPFIDTETKPKTKKGTQTGEEMGTETGADILIGGGTKSKTKTETGEEIKTETGGTVIPNILIDVDEETKTGDIIITKPISWRITDEETKTPTDTVFLEDITPQIDEITTPVVEPIVVPTQESIPPPYPPEYPLPPPPPTTKNGESALGWEFALSVLEQAVKKNPIVDDPLSVEIDVDFDVDLFGGGKKRSGRRRR